MSKLLFLDFETYSPVPITRGLDVYMVEAEIMLAQWAIGPAPVQVHDLTDDPIIPVELDEALRDPAVKIVAHNATFERLALRDCWGMDLPPERFFCTMACAMAHALPGGLGMLSQVLRVVEKLDGKDHIHLFCKPQPSNHKLRRATRETHPEQWDEFVEYAKRDVETCREVYQFLPKENYVGEHYRLWCESERINDRGFATDVDMAEAAVELLKADKERLDARTQELTEGELRSASQRDKLLLLLCRDYGVLLESMQASSLNEALEDDRLPNEVKELIKVRIATAMASTAKFSRLLHSVGRGNRLRGTLLMNGASRTGRWSGRIFQPQNLRRPTLKLAEIELIVEAIKQRDTDTIDLLTDLREACSNAMRGLIVAEPGNHLVVSDWSGIESRVLAWLAGEEWVLDVSREADEGVGKDLYVHTIARAYNMQLDEIDSYLRQQGKGLVLSMGYEGGVKAFLSIAAAYGMDIAELAQRAPDLLPFEHMLAAERAWDWAAKKKRTFGLTRAEYIACDAMKRAYREANARIAQQWKEYKQAFTIATQYPGEKVETGRCLFHRRGNWLRVELPSGRVLRYPSPRVAPDGQLSYMGPANKRWVRIKTYGGKLAENITQAVSNDVLRESLLALIDDGFSPVLHVHDEIICEQAQSDDYHSLARMDAIMRRNPRWAEGLPLHTEGYVRTRYKK